MKVYISDSEKLTKYNLPKEVQESYLIQYQPNGSKKVFDISIESNENNWILKSNGMVNVIENNYTVQSATLSNYYTCELKMSIDNEKRYLYCLPNYNEKYTDFSIYNMANIVIGNGYNCNINFPSPLLSENHVVIQNNNNNYLLTTSYDNVYVNGLAVKQTFLKCGDIIFVAGLKIIFMQTFVRINNPNNQLAINGMQYYTSASYGSYKDYEKIDTSEFSIDLYDEDKMFYHVPRILNGYDEKEVSIDAPPEEDKLTHTPLILSLGSSLTMVASSFVMISSVYTGLSTGSRSLAQCMPQIIMCVAMIFGSLLMPRITELYNNKLVKKRAKKRLKKYSEYLAKKEKEIINVLNEQIQTLNYTYPSMIELNSFIIKMDRRVWERQPFDIDFLDIMVGIGNRRPNLLVKIPEKGFEIDEDELKNQAISLADKYKYIENAPITYSLIERKISAIMVKNTYKREYINSLILQLATMHSAGDLKLVFLVNNEKMYEYAKYLPHTWSEDKKNRLFASSISDIKEVCELLEKEKKERRLTIDPSGGKKDSELKDCYKDFNTYYLIISDSYKTIKDIPFINELIHSNVNFGFSLLFIENTLTNLPPECKTLTYIKDDECFLIEPGEKYSKTHKFSLPNLVNLDMNYLASLLLNIPIPAKEGTAILPKRLTFLEMYKVSKIEQLNILNRWKTNNPVLALNTPIGVHADGDLFMLNLHEKAHGPHGLIAGSTGSGKSEFIITFVLSMAINFNPYEVQFVLIDYKGGGLAGAFENRETGISLPHLAGTITNLDTAEMNRTLVSINSELKRRQAKFNEVRDKLGEGTIDIYKYQKLYREGLIDESIAHLFIISDEFAELKSQQPEFMQELISTARIGRSLGVHLILATQKPSGVVNDQIWSNSKFKICLKVQDRSDSMEMIRKPDAASIKEPGRFYLQVGFDEYFDIGQSGYSGAEYVPSDKIIKKQDDSVTYISSIGNPLMSYEDDVTENNGNKEKLGDQLTNIVKYIVDISKKQKIKTSKLWLSSIPDVIQLGGLLDKYDYEAKEYEIKPAIGEYDNPAAQTQGLLTFDLTNVGHLLVLGMASSGKENLLTTLIYNTCVNHSPEEVNFYILDYGAETLRIFNKYPHVGAVLTQDDQEQMINTLVMIDEEADKRKALFVDYGGTYKNYIKESGNKLPLIVVVINYYEVFLEGNARLADAMQSLIREGSKYGIVFIVTTSVNNSLNQRVQQLFLNKVSLQQPDPQVYRNILNTPRGLAPKKYFGRGLALMDGNYYEFQTAYICAKDDVNKLIRETAVELNKKYKTKARSSLKLPDEVTLSDMESINVTIDKVPIGVDKESVSPYLYNFDKNSVTPIISKDMLSNKKEISAIIKELNRANGLELNVVDAKDILGSKIDNIDVVKDNFTAQLADMINGINKESIDNITRVYVIVGFNSYKNKIDSNYISYLNSLMENISKFKKSKIIIIDDYDEFKNLQVEDWFSSAIDTNYAIWLGKGVSDQSLLNFDNLGDKPDEFDYVCYVTFDKDVSVLKCVIDKDVI